MKIHIVQKGDSLYKIAKKYGVDYNALKSANAQLSNPDLIMPGMKIKIPSASTAIKKNLGAGAVSPKEYVKEVQTKQPASEIKTLSIEEEEEVIPEAGSATEQPAMQPEMLQQQKEYQLPTMTQKEMPIQKETPVQKEVLVQKEAPIQKEVPVQKEAPITKTAAPQKETTKFSINILPQPPQPPTKNFHVASEFKVGGEEKKAEKPIVVSGTNKANTEAVSPIASKGSSDFQLAVPNVEKAKGNMAVSPAAGKSNVNPAADKAKANPMPEVPLPSFTAPTAEKGSVNALVSPIADKGQTGAPSQAISIPGLSPVQAEMPKPILPAADKNAGGFQTLPLTGFMPQLTGMPSIGTTPAQNPGTVSPLGEMPNPSNPGMVSPLGEMPNLSNPGMVSPLKDMPNLSNPGMVSPSASMPYGNATLDNMAATPSQSYMPSYDPYAAPVVSPVYEMNPYGAMPMPTYVQPQYMPYSPYPQHVPAYPPQPPYYAGVPYQPPYPYPPLYPGYVQGAYMQPESSSFMQPHHHAPYESSSLQMPKYEYDLHASAVSPAYDPNMPPPAPATNPYAPQEDCGCSEPQPSYPYAPQPGGPYGAPYYPPYQQVPYYQPMPYTPYAPQPGMPYYRPAQTAMFGTPDIDDEDETE